MNDYVSIKPAIEALELLGIKPYVTRYTEIGVQEGNSLAYMLGEFPEIEQLVLCDTWGHVHGGTDRGNHDHITPILENYSGDTVFLDGDSQTLLPKYMQCNDMYFDIAFIDATHQAIQFWNDLSNLLLRAGIIICHDMVMTGMKEVAWCHFWEKQGRYIQVHIGADSHGAAIFIDIDYIKKANAVASKENFNGYNVHYYDMLLTKDAGTAEAINAIRWHFVRDVSACIVLDYGCASNAFSLYRPTGTVVDSYDIGTINGNPYPQTGIRFAEYDLICLWDVIEHVDWIGNPDQDMIAAIKMSDWVAAAVPIVPSTGRPTDWRHNRPEHLTYFTEVEFICLMESFGLKLAKSGTPECPPRKDVMSFLFKNIGR